MKEFKFVVPVQGPNGVRTPREFVFQAAGYPQARAMLSQHINPGRQPAQ